jgi:hypothetical protein
MADQLIPRTLFPDLSLNIAGGKTMSLPDDIKSTYSIILFYRGHW